MEKVAFLEMLKGFNEVEDTLSVAREVSELRGKFEDVVLEEERKFQVATLEAKESGKTIEEPTDDGIKDAFYEIYTQFKERRNVQQREKKESEEANLRRKKALIDQLREVVEKEENIGAALAAYKEIHDKWKEVGDIPRDKRQEIQHDYSRLLETFFYHIKIYRELRDHDFHRNQQLKVEVITKVQALANVENLKEVENSLKALQNEWLETGPVQNEDWEKLKESYWEAVRACYTRVQSFYDEKRGELQNNLDAKKAIVEKAKLLVEESNGTSAPEWETSTNSLLALQQEWKTIGYGPKKENEETWQEFRGVCDAFFGKKKVFFDQVRGQFDEVADKKKNIVAKLEEIKNNTEWKTTTDQVLGLQKQWKELGSAGQRFEQKLWKEFRAACDYFFNAKQTFYSQQDEELAGNLTLKNELIEKIKATPIPEDKREALTLLKQYAVAFNEIGKVPMKQKDATYNAYREALNTHYEKLKLEGEEKERFVFQARVESLKSSPNAEKALFREKADLRDKINHLKSDILQYENNLGFFSKSKGADALRKEVETKIAASQRKIEDLQRKLKEITSL